MTFGDHYKYKFYRRVRGTGKSVDFRGVVGGLGIPLIVACSFLSGVRSIRGPTTDVASISITLVIVLYFLAVIAQGFPRTASWSAIILSTLSAAFSSFFLASCMLADCPTNYVVIGSLFLTYSLLVCAAAVAFARAQRSANATKT